MLGQDESMPCRGAEHPLGYCGLCLSAGSYSVRRRFSTPTVTPDGTEERTESSTWAIPAGEQGNAYPQL